MPQHSLCLTPQIVTLRSCEEKMGDQRSTMTQALYSVAAAVGEKAHLGMKQC